MSLGGAGDLGGAFIERGLKAEGRHRERGLTAGHWREVKAVA